MRIFITEKTLERIKPYLPKPRGKQPKDHITVINGILYVLHYGIPWRDMPSRYGSWKTAHSRFNRWSKNGVWEKIHEALCAEEAENQSSSQDNPFDTMMVDSTCVPVHRTATSLRLGPLDDRVIGKSVGGWTTKIHALVDGWGRPIKFVLTGGNVSDYTGAEYLLSYIPEGVKVFLGDKGYDADWIREILNKLNITPCIPYRSSRNDIKEIDKELYKERNQVERTFNRLKDSFGIAYRRMRSGINYLGAVHLVALADWLL